MLFELPQQMIFAHEISLWQGFQGQIAAQIPIDVMYDVIYSGIVWYIFFDADYISIQIGFIDQHYQFGQIGPGQYVAAEAAGK